MSRQEDRPAAAGAIAERTTAARRAIYAAVEGRAGAFSVSTLLADVRAVAPGIGLATVYRTLNAMVERGHLERVGRAGGAALYARCAHAAHHHHLVCVGCGMTVAADCPLPDADALAAESGFTLVGHELTLYGRCAECRSGGR